MFFVGKSVKVDIYEIFVVEIFYDDVVKICIVKMMLLILALRSCGKPKHKLDSLDFIENLDEFLRRNEMHFIDYDT